MEFSFEIPSSLIPLIEQPMYMVLWAVFGVMLLTLALTLAFGSLGKLFLRSFFDKVAFVALTSLLATWLTGFISMTIFLFTGISGIKMLLIWITLFIGYLIFSIIYRQELLRLSLEYNDKKKPKE